MALIIFERRVLFKVKVKDLLVLFLIIALVTSLSITVFARQNDLPQQAKAAFDQRVAARVDVDRALNHIEVLAEEIGPRRAGLEGEYKAALYIADYLEGLGYQVEIQEFAVPGVKNVGHIILPDGTV